MALRVQTSLVASALLCAACGPIAKLPSLPSVEVEAEQHKEQIDQIRDYFAQLSRLDNVSFRIRVANRDDCKDRTSAQIGLSAGNVASLPRKYRSFSHEALSVSWTQATVLAVAETSPAAAAGIKPGDHLLTFNNQPVPRYRTARWISAFVRDKGERPIQVLVRRDGVDQTCEVIPMKACDIPIDLKTDSDANAFTTDDEIVVHSSILRLAQTDAQLALVVGHELAHSNLGHLGKQRTNALLGWAGGAALDAGIMLGGVSSGGAFTRQFTRAGAQAFNIAFEREADYVGAYYAARAGYELAGAEGFWRALSLENPDNLRIATDHPVTPIRFIQMRKAAAEIADKQRRGLPLNPELKALETVSGAETIPQENFH